MTTQQEVDILNEIYDQLPIIALKHNLNPSEIEELLEDSFISDDDYTVIKWPKVQSLFDKPDFDMNASLANSEFDLERYGSGAYYVNKKWLQEWNF